MSCGKFTVDFLPMGLAVLKQCMSDVIDRQTDRQTNVGPLTSR